VATRTHILFLALTLSVSAVSAQQNETKPAPTHGNTLSQRGPSPEAAAAAALEASPEMHSLSRFLGTWSITYVLDPTAAMPRGGTGEGQEVYRPGPGGHSLIEEFRGREIEGDVTGLGTLWWEEGSHGYRTVWCSSLSPRGCTIMKHPAKWENGELVLGDEWEAMGKKFTFKEVFSEISPRSFTQTLYQSESGGELKRIMLIKATKVPDAIRP
jgi:hypothetical protein